jgi:hypothetical protein
MMTWRRVFFGVLLSAAIGPAGAAIAQSRPKPISPATLSESLPPSRGAPGPIVGAGLPMLALIGGGLVVMRRRSKSAALARPTQRAGS